MRSHYPPAANWQRGIPRHRGPLTTLETDSVAPPCVQTRPVSRGATAGRGLDRAPRSPRRRARRRHRRASSTWNGYDGSPTAAPGASPTSDTAAYATRSDSPSRPRLGRPFTSRWERAQRRQLERDQGARSLHAHGETLDPVASRIEDPPCEVGQQASAPRAGGLTLAESGAGRVAEPSGTARQTGMGGGQSATGWLGGLRSPHPSFGR